MQLRREILALVAAPGVGSPREIIAARTRCIPDTNCAERGKFFGPREYMLCVSTLIRTPTTRGQRPEGEHREPPVRCSAC